ncbi:MAG TPA: energy transducer TonB [Steroidobacteraceae bacterium]|jgi:TonB family protein|nr:energy transducer TonB [Steroidobacteraceae bacterium]
MKPRTAPAAPTAADHGSGRDRARALESSLPAPAAAARASLVFVALSEDPLLLEALTVAAIDQAAVVSSPSADRFADQLVANAAAVALIDAAAAPTPLDQFIANVHRQFPQLLLLLAGPALLQNQFTAQIADGTIFRFAHKPASAQRLKLFVDAALLRRQSLVDQATVLPLAAGNAVVGATGQNPFGNAGHRRPFWIVTTIFIALIAAAVGAVLWRWPLTGSAQVPAQLTAQVTASPLSGPAAAPAPADLAAQAAEAERESIDRAAADRAERDRLISESEAREAALAEQVRRTALGARIEQAHVYVQLAQKRLAGGALLEPANDSARDYVRSAVGLAPEDADVDAVALALGDALLGKLRAAIAAGDGEAAARWLQACRDYQINEATLATLRTQLDTLQHAQGTRTEEVLALQRDFNQHLGQGQLLEPGDETAFANYRRLKVLDPDNAALPMMLHSLRTAIAADVQARLARNDLAGAQQRLHAVEGDGLDGEELAAAAAAIDRAQAVATPEVVPEARLQRKHFVQPVYPPDALAKGVSGAVELEFTVTPDGKVTDIRIQTAEPHGVFEQAAISALSQSRYQPVQRDGVAVAQRARLRLRFQP